MFVHGELVEKIFSQIADGKCVDLVGSRGSGRTEALKVVTQKLREQNHTAMVVRGVGGGTPLEAVRVALPAAIRKTLADRRISLASLVDLLEEMVVTEPVVFLVDDSEQLDDASWVVLETLHKAHAVPILTVSLPGPPGSHGTPNRMTAAQPALRFKMSRLGPELVQKVLEDKLGRAIGHDLSALVYMQSAGIPGIAVAIAEAAKQNGLLREPEGLLRSSAEWWHVDLNGIFESLICSYEAPLRESLEILSIAGIISLGMGRELVGDHHLELLESHELISVFFSLGDGFIAVHPAGLVEYFRHQPLSARRLRLLEVVTNTLEGHRDQAALDYIKALWCPATAGRGTQLSHLIDQPVIRLFQESHQRKVLLAKTVWENRRSMSTANAYLQEFLLDNGSGEVISQIFEQTNKRADDTEGDESFFHYLHAKWHLSEYNDNSCIINNFKIFQNGILHEQPIRQILKMALEMETSSIPISYEEDLVPYMGSIGDTHTAAGIVLAHAHILSAKADDALRILDLFPDATDPRNMAHAAVVRGLALLHSGCVLEALEYATLGLQMAISQLERTPLRGHAYVACLALFALNRLTEAHDLAASVLRVGIAAVPTLFSTDAALAFLAAIISNHQGKTTAPELELFLSGRIGGRSAALPFGTKNWVLAAGAVTNGQKPAGAAAFNVISEQCKAQGFILASHSAAIYGMRAHFTSSRREEVDASLLAIGRGLFSDHIEASEALKLQDPERLEAVAQKLRTHPAPRASAEYFARAARMYEAQGEPERSARAWRSVHALAEIDPGILKLVVVTGGKTNDLSVREAQVASLVRKRLSNKEIADQLTLSVRTIESHINRIRRKTGAETREAVGDLG